MSNAEMYIEALERHYLVRTLDGQTLEPIFRVLCVKCRNANILGFKRISFSELVCDECGVKWVGKDSGVKSD